jgi:hypothetical protein
MVSTFYSLALKIKRSVHCEDEAPGSAVPPRFPINDGTLSNRQSSVFAVTGNPVPVYFHVDFFGRSLQTTSALFACGDFHLASPSLSGNLAHTTSEWRDYMTGGGMRQAWEK